MKQHIVGMALMLCAGCALETGDDFDSEIETAEESLDVADNANHVARSNGAGSKGDKVRQPSPDPWRGKDTQEGSGSSGEDYEQPSPDPWHGLENDNGDDSSNDSGTGDDSCQPSPDPWNAH